MTFPNLVEKVKMLDLICDPIRRTEYLDGSDECIGLFMKAIDPNLDRKLTFSS